MNYNEILTYDALEGEIWKDIKGYEGSYQISNYGRVRSLCRSGVDGRNLKGAIMHGTDNGNGYLSVMLTKERRGKRFYIHRLVAEHFILNPDNLSDVNHINEFEKWNNTVSNLEWMSHLDNMNYGTRKERVSQLYKGAPQNKWCRKVYQLDSHGDIVEVFDTVAEASRITGINYGGIAKCCAGEFISSGGFMWIYAEDYDPWHVYYLWKYFTEKHRL